MNLIKLKNRPHTQRGRNLYSRVDHPSQENAAAGRHRPRGAGRVHVHSLELERDGGMVVLQVLGAQLQTRGTAWPAAQRRCGSCTSAHNIWAGCLSCARLRGSATSPGRVRISAHQKWPTRVPPARFRRNGGVGDREQETRRVREGAERATGIDGLQRSQVG